MRDDNVQISPPLYIAHTVTSCWKCHEEMSVIALLAPHVIAPHISDPEGTACILSFIEELPEIVLRFVRNRFSSFQLRYSKMAESQYYSNTCPKCGIISGDFFLHCEPDGPFFAVTEEAAKEFAIEAIPLGECISVRAGGFDMGGDLILKHAKRLDAESAAGHKV